MVGLMRNIAIEIGSPTRFQTPENVRWFDIVGEEADELNRSRFEQMLSDKKIPEIDMLPDDKKVYISALISQFCHEFDLPLKVNNIWWDANGFKVTDISNIERFERQYSSENRLIIKSNI